MQPTMRAAASSSLTSANSYVDDHTQQFLEQIQLNPPSNMDELPAHFKDLKTRLNVPKESLDPNKVVACYARVLKDKYNFLSNTELEHHIMKKVR